MIKDPVTDAVVWARVPGGRGPRAAAAGRTSTAPAARSAGPGSLPRAGQLGPPRLPAASQRKHAAARGNGGAGHPAPRARLGPVRARRTGPAQARGGADRGPGRRRAGARPGRRPGPGPAGRAAGLRARRRRGRRRSGRSRCSRRSGRRSPGRSRTRCPRGSATCPPSVQLAPGREAGDAPADEDDDQNGGRRGDRPRGDGAGAPRRTARTRCAGTRSRGSPPRPGTTTRSAGGRT